MKVKHTLLLMLCAVAITSAARADAPGPTFGKANTFTEQDGAAIYAAACACCHMARGQGAVGAGAYPALAHDLRLASPSYPISVLVHGRKAMPAFSRSLSDKQIAAVVDFIRTSFGNNYAGPPTAADVAGLR